MSLLLLLTNASVCMQLTEAIEALDAERKCSEYWHGKVDREAAAAGLAPVERGPRPPRPSSGAAPRPKRSRKTRCGPHVKRLHRLQETCVRACVCVCVCARV